MIHNLTQTISFILRCVIVGLIFAFLRHHVKWIYYPVKWFLTFILCLILLSISMVGFKLISDIIFGSGTSLEWFSQLMYDVGTSTELFKAGLIFSVLFFIIGTPVSMFVDKVIYYCELSIYSTANPPNSSFWWDVWGYLGFILFWFLILQV